MRAENINPFINTVKSICREVANIDVEPVATTIKTSPVATKDVVVLIGITGDLKGTVAVNLEEEFAKTIASKMMGGIEINELNELSTSAIKELFNITMGRVATEFYKANKKIDITPPNMLTGNGMVLSVAYLPLLSIKFQYDKYDMEFDISISDNEKN